ncbi:hypothetical protein AN958_01459 [Leucoagaricus sp. SymC.cos]|nr:hypothetical protein AN958_01459 [Leucoagaricus sp. SymC.cos]
MREHLARAGMEEVASSVSGSPISESKARIAHLTDKVKRAVAEANGNPADGRWASVSDILRLHCTRGGRHWMDVNLDAQAPEVPKHLCVIPKTNEEWEEVERKLKELTSAEFEPLTPEITIVQEHVGAEETAQPHDVSRPQERSSGRVISLQNVQQTLKTVFSAAHPLSSGPKFGFNVVKRSNVIVTGKPKPRKPFPPPSSSPPPYASAFPNPPSPVEPESESKPLEEGHSSVPVHRTTVNISDSVCCVSSSVDPSDLFKQSFIPPSFSSSQIQTSTQLPNPGNRLSLPSSIDKSLLTPPPKAGETSGQAHIFQPITLHDNTTSLTRKRVRSPSSEEPNSKRIRSEIEDVDGPSTPPQLDTTDMPVTPPRKDLPHLKELLASATRSNRSTPKKRSSRSPVDLPMPLHVSDLGDRSKRPLTPVDSTVVDQLHVSYTNYEPLAPASVSEPQDKLEETSTASHDPQRPPSPGPRPLPNASSSGALDYRSPKPTSPADDVDESEKSSFDAHTAAAAAALESQNSAADISIQDALVVQESQPQTPISPGSPKGNPFRFPSIGPESLTSNLDTRAYNLYGLDALDTSPAKSLSSLAGSDSESDDEDGAERTLDNITTGMPARLHLLDGSEFKPQFTSTQKTGLEYNLASNANINGPSSDALNWGNEKLPSTSQLQAGVNSQVDEFDKFMEADLGYDVVTPGL